MAERDGGRVGDARWVEWFNNRRLLELIGNIPPAEFEVLYDQRQASPVAMTGLKQSTLRRTRGGSEAQLERIAASSRMSTNPAVAAPAVT